MVKYIFLILITIQLVSSCGQKKNTDKSLDNEVSQDSAIMIHLGLIFNDTSKYWIRDFKNDYPKQRIPKKEIVIYPGKYKLRNYYFGDGQSYSPFGIKVSSYQDSIIDFFAFGDEIYYMRNSINAHLYLRDNKIEYDNRNDVDSSRINVNLLNLEKNLNNCNYSAVISY